MTSVRSLGPYQVFDVHGVGAGLLRRGRQLQRAVAQAAPALGLEQVLAFLGDVAAFGADGLVDAVVVARAQHHHGVEARVDS